MKKIVLLILNLSMMNLGWALDCTPPINLTTEKGQQRHSRAAMNSNGAAVVVWIKFENPHPPSLQVCTRDNAHTSWNAAQTISQPLNIQTYLPNVSVDGIYTIVWNVLNPSNQSQYYYSKKESPASQWIQGQAIDYKDLTITKDVVVDFKGDPVVLAANPRESSIYSYKYPEKSNKPYTGLLTLPGSEKNQTYALQMVMNRQGKIVALWGNQVGLFKKNYDFWVSSYDDDTGKWSTEKDIGSLKFNNLLKDKVKDISACLNKNQDVAVIWSHFDAESAKHKLKSLIKTTEELQGSQHGFKDPSILMDDEGNTVAVWIQTLNHQNVVYAAFKPKEKETWQGEHKVLSNASSKAEHVQLGFHNGVFVVVWGEASAKKRAIFGATLAPKPENFDWTPAKQLSPPNLNCWYPSMAFSEKDGIITWTAHAKRSIDFEIHVANLTVP